MLGDWTPEQWVQALCFMAVVLLLLTGVARYG